MNAFRTTTGIVSGLALSLVLGIGMASAQTADTGTSVELLDDPLAEGCVVSVTGGTGVDFGDLTWDGDSYEGTATAGSVTVLVSTDTAPGNRACPAVTVFGTDLANGSTSAFPASAISVGTVTSLGTTSPGAEVIAANANVIQGGQSTPLAVELDESAVNNAAPHDVYTGTITFSIGTGLE